MKKPEWATIEEAQGFLGEAEELPRGTGTEAMKRFKLGVLERL
jgi:hypothetical protein